MTTWGTLLDGYNANADVLANNFTPFSDAMTASRFPDVFLDFLTTIPQGFEFLFYSFVVFFVILIFFAFAYVCIDPLIRRLTRIW